MPLDDSDMKTTWRASGSPSAAFGIAADTDGTDSSDSDGTDSGGGDADGSE